MNKYTINTITTIDIPQNFGLLDEPQFFPPSSNNFLTITPKPGEDIAAKFFRLGTGSIPMNLSLQGDTDSQTEFPSKFEWKVNPNAIGTPLYKIVLQDSENPTNDPNFVGGGTNQVYVWIYFGVPGNVLEPIVSTTDLTYNLDIDFDPDALTLSDVLPQGSIGSSTSVGTINTITI